MSSVGAGRNTPASSNGRPTSSQAMMRIAGSTVILANPAPAAPGCLGWRSARRGGSSGSSPAAQPRPIAWRQIQPGVATRSAARRPSVPAAQLAPGLALRASPGKPGPGLAYSGPRPPHSGPHPPHSGPRPAHSGPRPPHTGPRPPPVAIRVRPSLAVTGRPGRGRRIGRHRSADFDILRVAIDLRGRRGLVSRGGAAGRAVARAHGSNCRAGRQAVAGRPRHAAP